MASAGCAANNSTLNAQFFNPSPAWQGHAAYDKGYDAAIAAAEKHSNNNFPNDDIVWLLWGLMRTVGDILQAAGKSLNRQGFVYSTEHLRGVHTGVYPDLSFSPSDHFGANQVQVLKNVCKNRGPTGPGAQSQDGYYVTIGYQRTAF